MADTTSVGLFRLMVSALQARPKRRVIVTERSNFPTDLYIAQGVADLLVRAGVTSLLNFAPRVLTVPPTVYLRYVDLSIELQVLGFYRARQEELARGGAAGAERGAVIRSVGLSRGSDLD